MCAYEIAMFTCRAQLLARTPFGNVFNKVSLQVGCTIKLRALAFGNDLINNYEISDIKVSKDATTQARAEVEMANGKNPTLTLLLGMKVSERSERALKDPTQKKLTHSICVCKTSLCLAQEVMEWDETEPSDSAEELLNLGKKLCPLLYQGHTDGVPKCLAKIRKWIQDFAGFSDKVSERIGPPL